MSLLQRAYTSAFLTFIWVDICQQYEASVTGGCRTAKRNQHVGGSEGSRHTFEGGWGLACDFWFDDPNDRQPARRALEEAGYYTYVGPAYEAHRLHVQGFRAGDPLP